MTPNFLSLFKHHLALLNELDTIISNYPMEDPRTSVARQWKESILKDMAGFYSKTPQPYSVLDGNVLS